MMTAPLAEPALTNVLLKLFPKATSTKLIRTSAQIVEHALTYALLKQYIRFNRKFL